MLFNLIKKNNLYLIVILLGFILSVTLSSYYVFKYDKYNQDNYSHQLIKDETYYHWSQGSKIADEVRKGKSFFLSGDVTFTKPLLQRIIGLYSLITGYDLIETVEQKTRVSLGGKLPYLIFQSLFYFTALIYFSKKLIKILPNRAFLYVIFFLSLELTIFQFHSSFFTESIYFSLQLIILGLLLERRINFSYNLLIGLLIGFLFLQRTAGYFYIFPVLLCYLFLFRKNSIKPLAGIIVGYTIIVLLIGSYNFYKTNVFYIFPSEGKYVLYKKFAIKVLADKLNISQSKAAKLEINEAIKWTKKNNIQFSKEINFNELYDPAEFKNYISNDVDKNKFFDYLNSKAISILIDSPLIAFKKTIVSTLHLIVLNPMFNYYYNEHRGKNAKIEFVYTNVHKKLIPYRIIYTLIIYFFCLIGFISLFKKKEFYVLSIITLSALYYVVLFGWYGMTRLYVPSLIYLSVLFGIGLDVFLNKLKERQLNIN